MIKQELTAEENNFNITLPTKQLLNFNKSLLDRVPRIIAEQGRLMGASMVQLDSALTWPDCIPKMERSRENVFFI